MGQDSEFAKGLKLLRQQLHDYSNSLRPSPAAGSHIREASVLPQGLASDFAMDNLDGQLDVVNLEESWSYLWNEDFTTLLSHNMDQDLANMYLLGVPQSWA